MSGIMMNRSEEHIEICYRRIKGYSKYIPVNISIGWGLFVLSVRMKEFKQTIFNELNLKPIFLWLYRK